MLLFLERSLVRWALCGDMIMNKAFTILLNFQIFLDIC